ncbi:hypothetical protein CLV49_0407 [Labedella gwakjiensis]|uniref:DUF4190 domain-containing protein n=1 Tax=Labedella gwakjiensis TaxID=390269 RepID=A0A2P8GS59_9MICO|nr:DUF4190 domain-containing protein [Labedella gwakjiensis]PSL36809.1 hypothetical protein CLV49_0407 [Labedella gwakjiensis]RUQ84317.1 DUF4190 domain-containing protein [Labedella gwakjiensis]
MSEQYPPASSQPGGAPQYSGGPQYGGTPNGPVPGRTLGIVGLILAFLLSPVGLVLSIVAMVQSRKAGAKNGFALAGIIIGIIGTIIIIVSIIAIAALAGAAGEAFNEVCGQLGSGVHEQDGITFTCP